MLNNALGRIENAVPRTRCFSLCFLKENPVKCRSGPATVRKSKAAWMNIRSLGRNLWEGAAARRFRARRTACFVRPADPRAMGRGADHGIGMIQRLSSWGKLFFMRVQEVKPKGRRLIGELSLRAAHNVHEVDACACSLCSFWQCWRGVAGKRKGVRSSRRK